MENTIKINRDFEPTLTNEQYVKLQKHIDSITDIEQLEAEKIAYEEKMQDTKVIICDQVRKVIGDFLGMTDKSISYGVEQWKQYRLLTQVVEGEHTEIDYTTLSLLNSVVTTTRVTTKENVDICLAYLDFMAPLNIDLSTISKIIDVYASKISRLLTEQHSGMKYSKEDNQNHAKLQKLGRN